MKSNHCNNKFDCIVVGAGAAGLFYAACDSSPGKKLILEKTRHPGQKLLMSGNGMCNITHSGSIKDFLSRYGSRQGKVGRIRSCLYKHSNVELMNFLENSGLPLVTRDDGKVFPLSLRAGDILDLLLTKATENGYELRCNCPLLSIKPVSRSDYSIELTAGNSRTSFLSKKLIIATGGASYPSTGSDGSFMNIIERDLGLKTVALKPSLSPVYLQNYSFENLSGISFENVIVSSSGISVKGPLLLTHKGLSGPAALHMSHNLKAGDSLTVNFTPEYTKEQIDSLIRAATLSNTRSVHNEIARIFSLPKAFVEAVLDISKAQSMATLTKKDRQKISDSLSEMTFSVSGIGGFKDSMVTAGGVNLSDIDTKNMSLTDFPSIRVIGEALDIHGETGGYNLQFAYSSAMAALDD